MKGLASVKAFHPFTYTYDISGYIRVLKNRAIRFNPKKSLRTAYLATSDLSKTTYFRELSEFAKPRLLSLGNMGCGGCFAMRTYTLYFLLSSHPFKTLPKHRSEGRRA